MNARELFYSFDPRTRLLPRRTWYFPADLLTTVSGRRKKLVPPKGLTFTGAGDFIEIGNRFAEKITEECALAADGKLLDIGCGIGRIARPFTFYLNDKGSYQGFDIVPEGVNWCKRHYRNYPNFHFDHVPLRNDLYNLSTNIAASEFTFPYNSQTFDAACAISVFTHMQPNDVARYFAETARVLKSGGSCLATFFIITDERLKNNGPHIQQFFPHDHGGFYLHDNRVKDANIAYRLDAIETMAREAGLIISNFITGWWIDKIKENRFDFQDVVVLKKVV